ncbi:tryptophan 7-halogenase [Sphingomonas rhizophila]|uniref:Tryptophan 7-halogenase n=1 Tax=Sphingomonas rhizophila TaxID=2071607 RepID=A0A7G9SBC7_9SPHN|nr:tryptophan 7-halogenase [Sphingomonas rhizophila]
MAAFSSAHIDERRLAKQLPALTGLPLAGDVVVAALRPGMRSPWQGNCIAIGEAAASLDPLDAMAIHVIHAGLSHLIALFPTTKSSFPEAAAYNRQLRGLLTGIRDFQAAHYALNRRFDEPLWDAVRDAAPPETLERKSRLFALRGDVPILDEEPFDAARWTELFVGHGVVPESYDPRVDLLPDAAHIQRVQQRLRDIATLVEAMPTVTQFLRGFQTEPAQ